MTIIVGIDGSEGSVEALRFALAEARLRRSDVRAVQAWQMPVAASTIGGPGLPAAVVEADFDELSRRAESSARAALDAAVEEAAPGGADVRVERRAVEGSASAVLVDAARGAELLVVGASGRGGVAGLLLGSVSRQCAESAPCPVVVVPLPGTRD